MKFSFLQTAPEHVEERGRRDAAGDGEAGAGAEPAHPRTEAASQRGPVAVQHSPHAQRPVPSSDALGQGRILRGMK